MERWTWSDDFFIVSVAIHNTEIQLQGAKLNFTLDTRSPLVK